MINKILFTAILISVISVIGLLLLSGSACGDTGSLTISKLKEKGSSLYGHEVQITGHINSSSIEWNAQNNQLTFIMTDGADSLNILYQGTDPFTISEMLARIAPTVNFELTGKYSATEVLNVNNIDKKHTAGCSECHSS